MGDTATAWKREPARPAPVAAPSQPAEGTVVIAVKLTYTEAEALRDGAFTCTSPDPARHNAGRRALLAVREAAAHEIPRPPVVF